MTDLMFRCPHCQAQVEVAMAKIEHINECSSCGRPFRPEVPAARMLQQRDDGGWTAVGSPALHHPAGEEKTIMTAHPAMFRANPVKYVTMVLVFVVGMAGVFTFAGPVKGIGLDNIWRPVTLALSIVCGVFALLSLGWLIYWLLRTRFESLVVTNERTIWARGIFDRETSEVQHDDVRNIQLRKTLIDRILGVGRIAISSAGQDDMEIDIRGVPSPSKVADAVRSCQARMTGRDD